VRKSVIAAVLLGLAIVVQLTVLNGLRLPGSGVPDLVLVLVAALAVVSGPLRGTVTGFIAGLCLDLAPPGSAVLGEYALAFCLVGWAAGKLSGLAARSALGLLAILAVVVAAGEAVAAGISLGLDPAQVSLADVRHVLPYSVAYDLLILPFAVGVAVRAQAAADRAMARRERAGAAASADHGNRARKRNKPRQPRLAEGFSRPHDGWVGTRPAGLAGHSAARHRPAVPHGLRPANGVAGSAVTGPTRRPMPAARPANLRLAAKRRRDGALGNAVGSSLGRNPGLHPGLRTTSGRFRPHGGSPGGSAAIQSAAIVQPGWRRPVTVSFSTRRGDASVGRLLGTSLSSLVTPRSRRIAEPRFRRQSAAVTPGLATRLNASRAADQQAIMSARRRSAPAPRLRLGSRRRRDGVVGGSVLRSAVAGATASGTTVVRPTVPRSTAFRNNVSRTTVSRTAVSRTAVSRTTVSRTTVSRTTGHGPHGSGRPSSPRFHPRPLPGSGARRPAKRPRFNYGRHSVLSFLARRPGGKWLASRRVGTRSGVWLLGRRTGGIR
jgi:rod shape-determining protein MreD